MRLLLFSSCILTGLLAAGEAEFTDADRQQAERWIKDLDSNDFEVRRAASDQLVRMGTRAFKYLRHRLAELGKEEHASSETLTSLRTCVDTILDPAVADLDEAVTEAPDSFVPPEPELMRKLSM